ncbi:ABC-type transport auxiliary lipoprotein family protein [Primorskyibacter sedentarius]|uniref:ABC-type transport auxiliary lipoprotein family protein n=1 Tax=Primorskyibacter sedentarius TaxID=745311 RepID=UPI003EC11AF4
MTPASVIRFALFWLGLSLLAGCSALSSIESASQPLNTFELSPLPAGAVAVSRGRSQLEVAAPTATGALTSDRIVIKPNALQVQVLPEARWVDETTEHVQLLLVRSLTNSGMFGLVSAEGAGPRPDFLLLTDLQAFQVKTGADQQAVVIRTNMTLLRDDDGAVVSARSFENSVPIADTTAGQVVFAFDQAMTQQMTDMLRWLDRLPGV